MTCQPLLALADDLIHAFSQQQVGPLQLNGNPRLREIQQLAAAAAAAAYPAAAFASLNVVPSGGFPADLSANHGLAASNYPQFGAPTTSMSYSAAVNGGFGPAGRGTGSDGQPSDSAGNEFNPYQAVANGNGRTTAYSSGGGSSSVVAAFEGANGGQAANSGGSGSGELFQPMRGDGVQRSSMDEDVSGGGQELTSSQLQVRSLSSACL